MVFLKTIPALGLSMIFQTLRRLAIRFLIPPVPENAGGFRAKIGTILLITPTRATNAHRGPTSNAAELNGGFHFNLDGFHIFI